MLIVTAGGWAEHYSPRGINGPIDDILFPIQHGMLFYPGFEVLPPLVFYRTDKPMQRFADLRELARRLDTLWKRAHSIPPAESWRLSDPVAERCARSWRRANGLAIHVKPM
jgi:NAD(P)H dehydrogenase (quinone)